MIVYQSTKQGFREDVFSNRIDEKILHAYISHLGRSTSGNEILSWKNSMSYMDRILEDPEIPADSGISIEFQIPLTSKRIDFIITGLNEGLQEQVIIIELKQWSSAELTDKDALVKTRFQHGNSETAHPSYQAWSYAATLRDYNQTIRDEHINLVPCAYLHNYPKDRIISNPCYEPYITEAPPFFQADAGKLRDFIKKFVKHGDTQDILYKIENGRLRPSKQLADSLASMLKGNREFIMLDDQKVVYETALSMSREASVDKKQVLIVKGGPGTGKSVVAINLLAETTQNGLVSRYVSKNAAPRAVYAAKLTGTLRKNQIYNMFGGSGTFYDIPANTFDVLIVDEAHRLNHKSGLFQNKGENQVREIIDAAKFTVFFVDDHQKIHIKDIGESQYIEKIALSRHACVKKLELSSQFRCNGSDGYLAWLDNTLQITGTANVHLSQEDFDFRIFSDPNELRQVIEEKNKVNNKSRMVAGYCWDWKSKKEPAATDVNIPEFGFAMKWNLEKDGSTWIIGENSINEIGCIHTCQGLEVDYIGVIIGKDLRYENGKVITDVTRRSRADNSVRGIHAGNDPVKAGQLAEEIIKNTYRTLLTRGMKGCYVYCCDKPLENYLRQQLQVPAPAHQTPCQPTPQVPRIEAEVNDDVKYIDYLPLYTLKAACGKFSEWQEAEEEGWVKTEGLGKLNPGMFIVRANGHSMEPRIKEGDLCVFRNGIVGSRNGKIVLIQHREHYDFEYGGCYSIKKYTSEKKYDPETGEWTHESIILHPLNKDYPPIQIQNEEGFIVIGEFIGTIQ